ncbi:MAG: hypothetical protein HYZ26_11740 [Chloroflexi bacterium]|nr:hypothetical protein [Chloroflexota bacterium]
MAANPIPNNRLAFQYYPDTVHYRQHDLQAWLPTLKALGAGWLVLRAPVDRAIPEPFVRALLDAGVQPVLHFQASPLRPPAVQELQPLLAAYAAWGVRFAALFDRPNCRDAWDGASWAKQDLVANFLNIALPLMEAASQAGLANVFPPLEPGGDYWDTAFLRAALNRLQTQARHVFDELTLGVYAWADNLPLDWGAGGPERWPAARPYYTPPGEEDHLGFRIFDWYAAVSQAELGRELPMLGLGGGSRLSQPRPEHPPLDAEGHAEATLHMLRLLDGQDETGQPPLPASLKMCSLGRLAAQPGSPESADAWFREGESPLPAAKALNAWNPQRRPRPAAKRAPAPQAAGLHRPGDDLTAEPDGLPEALPAEPEPRAAFTPAREPDAARRAPAPDGRSIRHYLLLPTYEWGVADWHLDVIRPFLKRHLPTVGFSVEEAAAAQRVTVVGGPQTFAEADLERLRAAGCEVVRVAGDGTSIASQLETL